MLLIIKKQLIILIKIISTGDKNCIWFNEYLKRMHWKVNVLTFNKTPKYLDLIDLKKEKIILLDEHGLEMTSIEFASFINEHMSDHLCFIVGSAEGFSKDLHQIPHQKIALSLMTMPHEMARVVLMEQIYRAQQILNRHPYHK